MQSQDLIISLTEKLVNHCSEIYKDLEGYIDNLETFTLPSYDDMKNPEFFLEEYSKYTSLSDKNHVFKVKCSKVVVDINSLLFELSKHNLNSLVKKYVDILKFHKDKCGAYAKILDTYQKDLTDVLNYFSAVHYTMTTPYRD